MALLTNLVAGYKLDESSGNASDATGNGNTLTNNNTVTYSAGIINNGADFGSSNSNKFLGISSNLGLTDSALSISGWFNVNTAPSSGTAYTCFQWSKGTGLNRAYELTYQNSAGTLQCMARCLVPSVAFYSTTYNIDAGTGNWHHMGLTTDGSTLTLYVDGTSQGTVSISGTGGRTLPDFFQMGKYQDDGGSAQFASTKVDEVYVWGRVLSGLEMAQLYNSGVGFQYPFATAITMTTTVGTFALTGVNTTFSWVAGTLTTAVGSFLLTGISPLLTVSGFHYPAKSSNNFSSPAKSTNTFSSQTKSANTFSSPIKH